MHKVLVIDDEPDILELLSLTLERMGLAVRTAKDFASAQRRLDEEAFDLCLTDMRLPDGDGLQLVRHIQSHQRKTPVAVITAHGSMETAVEALKAGAFDFVSKPVDLGVLRRLIASALKLNDTDASHVAGQGQFLGDSRAMREIREQIERVARTQAPVFISGESGTGKELVARLIHSSSPRADKPFVPVNCGAIPSELMESEFFGHKKGSFSGAVVDKAGLFQIAHGGTLFLDEVADLPLALQVKLLRVIQEKKVRPVGAVEETPVDVRIVSATHKPLAQLVAAGQFRQDLYYRIHVIGIEVPPLRERPEDIPVLIGHILERLGREQGLSDLSLSTAAMEVLRAHHFPGNVRELENILERAVALKQGARIEPGDLGLDGVAAPVAGGERGPESHDFPSLANGGGYSLEQRLEQIEKQAILDALGRTGGNRTQAARLLGMTLRQLNYRLRKWESNH